MMLAVCTTWSCANDDNAAEEGESTPSAGTVENPISLSEAIAEGGEIALEPGAVYTIDEEITTNGPVAIVGDEAKPATIIAKAGIVISNNFELANVEIDATEVETALFQLNPEPTAEPLNGTSYLGIEKIALTNVKATGVKHSIIWDSNKQYCVVNLVIDNSIIELATESTNNQAFISFQGGGVKDLVVKNSTVYQTAAAENNYFTRYHNSARLDRYGYDKNTETQSISYLNNTFYNVGQNGQFGNYNGMAGQAYSEWHVVANIFYNTGNGQVSRRILGGRNASSYKICEFDQNTYWFKGAPEEGNTSYDTGKQLQSDPNFRDPENGDFKVRGTEQGLNGTGDPRWLK